VGGKPVKDLQEYARALAEVRAGDKFELTVVRDGRTIKLRASLR